MKKIIIKEMEIDNYNEMASLWKKYPGMGINKTDSKVNVNAFLKKNKGHSFIGIYDGSIVGTILCGHDGRRGYVYHLAVDSVHRRKGIGKKLVLKSLRKLKDEGIKKCHIFVFKNNHSAKGFWDKVGWVKRNDIQIFSKTL